jgi:hypothetical protein
MSATAICVKIIPASASKHARRTVSPTSIPRMRVDFDTAVHLRGKGRVGSSGFCAHSHAFAVKLEPKRAGSKPVYGSGRVHDRVRKPLFWFVVQVPHYRRYPPQCRKRRSGDRFALPGRNERFATPHTAWILASRLLSKIDPFPYGRARHPVRHLRSEILQGAPMSRGTLKTSREQRLLAVPRRLEVTRLRDRYFSAT